MHNGVNSWCRECARTATRDWRDRNRDEINRARREAYGSAKAPPVPEDSSEGGLSHRPLWMLDERFGKLFLVARVKAHRPRSQAQGDVSKQ
jgi:hypothetical protein